ncbi:hypothetical protein BDV28DRAFT_73102 [Aspergillus coremiiformis]|uniref:Protein kinase domain-containing protein n=1 Tax=Aspergillus coremiiformis TaxID=138285 RepID=A0A5N6ZAP3_9EURO|nr:hypothetical protein BDV28DRAFT_73102 [Aspergillus coremiiformis]
MASTSEGDHNDLTSSSTNNHPQLALEDLRSAFFTGAQDEVDEILLDGEKCRVILLQLLLVLQLAVLKQSAGAKCDLISDLSHLIRVNSQDIDITPALPLLKVALDRRASSTQVWSAALELIAKSHPTTPPATIQHHDLDTPFRPSSAEQRGAEQTHDQVDQRILEELYDRVFDNVGGFYEHFFVHNAKETPANSCYERSKVLYGPAGWKDWPDPPLQDPFFKWFLGFQETVLQHLPLKFRTSANKELLGSEAGRKLDIFLAPANIADRDHSWSDVLVIGEHKSNIDADTWTSTLVQLAGYAREVFGSQSGRRFVHAFTICGPLMRLWMFDRSGVYSSHSFNIHREPERFVSVLAGYASMTGAELGLNTFIQTIPSGRRFILCDQMKIELNEKPLSSQSAIVCRGTTCFLAKPSDGNDWEYVVKFSWPSDQRQKEGDLLELALSRGVEGIATVICHQDVVIDGNPDTTGYLRHGLQFGPPRRLSRRSLWVDPGSRTSGRSSQRGSRSRGMGRLGGRQAEINHSLSRSASRKRQGDGLVAGRPKRPRSIDSSPLTSREAETAPTTARSVVDSLAGQDSETYGNRVHCCLVISPAGHPLSSFTSDTELLIVIRDCISAHRSLFVQGNILHRDISDSNLIISRNKAGQPEGRLIDLDLAKDLDSGPSGATHRTGTMQFMAIEILRGKGHTYRHDLESFLYVLLWACIRYGPQQPRDVNAPVTSSESARKRASASRLQKWYTGTYEDIADVKRGHMDKNGFEDIINEFPPSCERLKPVARRFRSVLFPIRDEAIFTGTFRDSSIMYDGVLRAINSTLEDLLH